MKASSFVGNVVRATVFALFTGGVLSAGAADIAVQPGVDTLQNAADTASPGDTLTLTTGTYSDSDDTVSFDKPLTIRALSSAETPIVTAAIAGAPGTNGDDNAPPVIIQGLTLSSYNSYNQGIGVSYANKAYIIENTIEDCLSISTNSNVRQGVVVGNTINCPVDANDSNGGAPVINADIAAGNIIFVQDRQTHPSISANYVIGNKLHGYADNFGTIIQGKHVVGNRVDLVLGTWRATAPSEIVSLNDTSGLSTLAQNNMVSLSLASDAIASDMGPLTGIGVANGNARIINNVLRYDGSVSGTDSTGFGIDSGSQYSEVLGNVITGFSGDAVNVPSDQIILNNLCYQNKADCGADQNSNIGAVHGNIQADPLFGTDYTLNAGSPAIDAGPEFNFLRDVTDGTRNDMGVHGGAFPIAQFDSQRADSSNPWVFPLFDANSQDVGETLEVKVLGVARLP